MCLGWESGCAWGGESGCAWDGGVGVLSLAGKHYSGLTSANQVNLTCFIVVCLYVRPHFLAWLWAEFIVLVHRPK